MRQYQRRNGTRGGGGGGGNCSAGSCQAVIHRVGVSALDAWCEYLFDFVHHKRKRKIIRAKYLDISLPLLSLALAHAWHSRAQVLLLPARTSARSSVAAAAVPTKGMEPPPKFLNEDQTPKVTLRSQ